MITLKSVESAALRLEGVVRKTPLELNLRLSERHGAKIYIKREDLQEVRSYKIRGAYHCMSLILEQHGSVKVVCASAGNHAQGVAFSAKKLKMKAVIFMPVITPLQKIQRVQQFGQDWVSIQLVGTTFDECYEAANQYCRAQNLTFIHPFDDLNVMVGQATCGKEILDQMTERGETLEVIVCPVGGGGFIAGVSSYLKMRQPSVRVIGAEPKKAASMKASMAADTVVSLEEIDTFVDGASVKTVGNLSFECARQCVDEMILVEEGAICSAMIDLYQNEGIVAEPAGALSLTALDELSPAIKGKTVVCVLSGGNNDIMRYPEILEKSLVYQGRKHYFLIEFAQKPGQLKQFLNSVLGSTDDIARFEYIKKNAKERGPALVGVELAKKEDLGALLDRMERSGIHYVRITADDSLYSYLI